MTLAVLLIDMQPTFTRMLRRGARARIVAHQLDVIRTCAQRGIWIWRVEFSPDKYGLTIPPLMEELDRTEKSQLFIKKEQSAFTGRYGRQFTETLQWYGITTLFFMGINANACVLDSAAEAQSLDFKIATHADVIDAKRATHMKRALTWFGERDTLHTFDDVLARPECAIA